MESSPGGAGGRVWLSCRQTSVPASPFRVHPGAQEEEELPVDAAELGPAAGAELRKAAMIEKCRSTRC